MAWPLLNSQRIAQTCAKLRMSFSCWAKGRHYHSPTYRPSERRLSDCLRVYGTPFADGETEVQGSWVTHAGPRAVAHVAEVVWSLRTELKDDAKYSWFLTQNRCQRNNPNCPDNTVFKNKPVSPNRQNTTIFTSDTKLDLAKVDGIWGAAEINC